MYCHCLFLAEAPDPFWTDTVHGFQRMGVEELNLFSKHVDWQSIQAAAAVAAAAAAAASSYSPTYSCGPGDGSIDSYTAAESATAFVDGYTFNTVSTCITHAVLCSRSCEGGLYMPLAEHLANSWTAPGLTPPAVLRLLLFRLSAKDASVCAGSVPTSMTPVSLPLTPYRCCCCSGGV
jgi:hypothetical protein